MNFLKILPIFAGVLMAGGAQAAVVATSTNFVGAGSIAGWTSVGATATLIQHITTSQSPGTAGDGTGGDGTASDGALIFNLQNAVSGDEAIAFAFSGTMASGESYSLTVSTYNPTTSFNGYTIQLYNATDNVVLTQITGLGQNGNTIGTVDRVLNYNAVAGDAGDTLQFRIVETGNNAARDIAIDTFTLSVVPEPSVALLGGLGVLALLRRCRA